MNVCVCVQVSKSPYAVCLLGKKKKQYKQVKKIIPLENSVIFPNLFLSLGA